MRLPLALAFPLILTTCASCLPALDDPQVILQPISSEESKVPKRIRPLVLWHGLGDAYASKGMIAFTERIKEMHPGIFVHSAYIKEDLGADQQAGFFGNVNEQIDIVASQLASIDELKQGFDAIGFSQGGQFLRAYVERYNNPPVNNLLTFGSQHMGIANLPPCHPMDYLCQLARRAANVGIHTDYAQSHLVQAQYFRDPESLSDYYKKNRFLTSINNEILNSVNRTYAENLASISNLILVLFSEDKTVVPKESSWFGSYAPSSEASNSYTWPGRNLKTIVPMRLQPTYIADTFGLRTLDERGGISLVLCKGEHMQLFDECWVPLVQEYVGGRL